MQSIQGALMVMISHGLSTGALFFLIGMIYERRHTRLIADFGGIAAVVPGFAAMLTFVSLSSVGLPATNGFIGEFLVLLGSFRAHPWATGSRRRRSSSRRPTCSGHCSASSSIGWPSARTKGADRSSGVSSP